MTQPSEKPSLSVVDGGREQLELAILRELLSPVCNVDPLLERLKKRAILHVVDPIPGPPGQSVHPGPTKEPRD